MTATHARRIASVLGLLVAWQLLIQTGKLSEQDAHVVLNCPIVKVSKAS